MPQAFRPETAQPLESVLAPNMAAKAPELLMSFDLRKARALVMAGSVAGTPDTHREAIAAPVMSMSPGVASASGSPSALPKFQPPSLCWLARTVATDRSSSACGTRLAPDWVLAPPSEISAKTVPLKLDGEPQ
ncbi:hypothetical protein SMD44_07964 [Streptomyces alboflavus]|uniref:Uncharacterized protein n=1 Tax=Streptomyces alboflavus TaxID=67267 RepID=A0A1Z1WPX4_9ACTN|nr:hypothetical protein SMD44_07964 [Streptomyces alboflavus]